MIIMMEYISAVITTLKFCFGGSLILAIELISPDDKYNEASFTFAEQDTKIPAAEYCISRA
jgi:hypothetical protein